jgi:hypothetical protein
VEGFVFDSKKWFEVSFFIRILGAERKKLKLSPEQAVEAYRVVRC